ncbi:MAG: YbaB/EbfC family nucleoid-associated protein [Bacilli bacterium]|nr:YbaB/EbfC family nucleoid-associated protein [Bacilli bacterium]
MNQQAMLRKMRQMQKELQETQEEIANTDFKQSAGGVVTVTVKGTKEIVSVEISEDFEAESKEDLEMLQDMIVAACNNAYKEIDKTTEEKMAKYQAFFGGMGGLF